LNDKYNASIAFDDFYPAFLDETKLDGATYGLPFQRSTPILFYNADALDAVGVTAAPATWDDVVSAGTKLMAAKKLDWGVQFPTGIWQYQGLAIEAGQDLNAPDLSHVNLNTPAAVAALQWLVDLSAKYKISPKGVIDGLAAPAAFSGGKVGMLYNSSGSLSGVLTQSKFKVGTAFMPKKEKYGAPTGGGNLYIFKNVPAERQRAALTFLDWMTQPEQGARWSIASGYVPARKGILQTASWQDYIQKQPLAQIAIDQLQYAVPSLRTHASNQVGDALLKAMQAAVTGQSSASSALSQAQKTADSILAQYR
jgi:sn-glycerol 3-phosphate transport system substrate-binding protein